MIYGNRVYIIMIHLIFYHIRSRVKKIRLVQNEKESTIFFLTIKVRTRGARTRINNQTL